MVGALDLSTRPHAKRATVRVFIAVHVRLYREALEELLAREEAFQIVGASGDRDEILARVAEAKPDVVLLDPAATASIDMIRELADPIRRVRVVALASFETELEVIAHAEAGVSGFVTREESLVDLVATILRAAEGNLVVSPQTAGTLLRRLTLLAAQRPIASSVEPLTAREFEVALLLDEGLSNQQIANRLHLELSTVKHVRRRTPQRGGRTSSTARVARPAPRQIQVAEELIVAKGKPTRIFIPIDRPCERC